MTGAKKSPLPQPRDKPARAHAILLRMGEWRLRHPRRMLAAMTLILLLPALLYLGLAWIMTAPGEAGGLPTSSITLIAPDDPSRRDLQRDVNQATPAERERIATLSFVLHPFPYMMPLQSGMIPSGENLQGSDTGARTKSYVGIGRLFQRSGCADDAKQITAGRVTDAAALKRAEEMLIPLQAGSDGVNLARYFYYSGLLQLCNNDMRQAYNAFKTARATLEKVDSSPDPNSTVGQYRYVSAAGERLAAAQIDATLPTLPDVPGVFGSRLCPESQFSDGCALFHWPKRRTALVELHTFLLDPHASATSYRDALADAGNGYGTLSARNFANTVVAHAKAGDYENVASLLNQTSSIASDRDCDALGRIANIGWITGKLDQSSDNFTCSRGGLPTNDGTLGTDFKRIEVWEQVHRYRAALRVGNFQELIAWMHAIDKQSPDERAFLERVRTELLARLSKRLLAQAEQLRKKGSGEKTRTDLLKLLRLEAFPFATRMSAAIALSWGPVEYTYWVPAVLTLLLLILLRLFWDFLAGYRLMFTQRHYQERQSHS
ncbi:hypothetical protein [Stakelama tenebrarum]|uniref:Uncharacterized protein n=1 Tax=Stakelama tenebrarum TaxID=2711215 RepID=A0A6G6Y8N7_9SPHN|nr:hypothetical protein [Sphingosinithalassobacter tenebrarum]QIG81078.1 hypothetical protein G5C33_15665 [Sphingosinithalassobacter tenebrarum]